MAEPFSIAVGVVGVVVPALHGTRKLVDDVTKIIDAPEAIRSLREDLTSAALALESLKAIPESEWESLGSNVAEQSKHAVETCGSACDTFRGDLQRWTRRSRNGELSWRDRANIGFFKERQIKAMSEHLQSCKLTCSSVVGMGTLYTSLRTGHMTEELKSTITSSREELSSVARRNDNDILVLRRSLEEMSAHGSDSIVDEDEEDDRISAETQVGEQKAALESCRGLFAELQSMLKEEKIKSLTTGGGGNANVSFGSITSGFGVGISNAPISNVTFGSPSVTRSSSERRAHDGT